MEQTQEFQDTISIRELLETIWKGKILIAIITAIALLISVIASFVILPEQYEAKVVLNAEPIEIATQPLVDFNITIDSLTRLPTITMPQYVQHVKSSEVLEKTATILNMKDDNGTTITAGRLADMVVVRNTENSTIIEIIVRDTDGQRASVIANELSLQYIQFISETYNEQSQKVMDSIAAQLEIEKQNLNDRSTELTDFLETNGSIEMLNFEADDLVLQIIGAKNSISNYETMIVGDSSALNILVETTSMELKTDLSQYLVNVSLNTGAGNTRSNPKPQDEADINQTQQNSSNINQTQQNSPYVNQTPQDLVEQLQLNLASDDLGQALQRIELNRIQMRLLNSLTSREAELLRLEQLEARLQEITPNQVDLEFEYNNLIGNLDSAKLTYQAYELKLREAAMSIAANVAQSSVTITREAGVPRSPVSPNKKLNLAIGLVLGLMLGVFVVLFRAYWQNTASSNSKEKTLADDSQQN